MDCSPCIQFLPSSSLSQQELHSCCHDCWAPSSRVWDTSPHQLPAPSCLYVACREPCPYFLDPYLRLYSSRSRFTLASTLYSARISGVMVSI